MRIAYRVSHTYSYLFDDGEPVAVLGCRTRSNGDVYAYLVRKHRELTSLPYADMDVKDFTSYVSQKVLDSIPKPERLWVSKREISLIEKNSYAKHVLSKVDDE